ncbi:hypothetical protein [Jiangella endophytica]|uniref:hypothetical protein n=1 Tax=Jiangella endophytica TaxID=1623398 RepID=UPI000E340903|nr:hypothetical protein [Jiangella endophytica]
MRPNLERVPGEDDALAARILRDLPAVIDEAVLARLGRSAVLALGRYSARQVVVALRTRSAGQLRDALTAAAVCEQLGLADPRDTMVGLAPHLHVARELGLDAPRLFADVAGRLPAGDVATLVRTFGGRTDVRLPGFGWVLVDTPDGPDFVPAL